MSSVTHEKSVKGLVYSTIVVGRIYEFDHPKTCIFNEESYVDGIIITTEYCQRSIRLRE